MPSRTSAARSPAPLQQTGRGSDAVDQRRALATAVRDYLQRTPRQLPSQYLYDALGSALFDAICQLPWYRITRAELGLLERHAETIGRFVEETGRVVELGSGNGEKLAALLSRAGVRAVHAHLIDVSEAALARAVQTFAALDSPAVRVTTHRASYEDGLLALQSRRRRPTLVAFLGSNIGNFDPPGALAFLESIRRALQRGDCLLLGADLVKPERDLLLAYDDPLGVTAAFDLNLLLRLNTELHADFVLERFAHRAVWNAHASRVEMHLVSLAPQEVHVADADLRITLERGDTIWTESSYKYHPRSIRDLVEPAGFVERRQWLDEEAGFALTMFCAR
jgi:dimethylhistidine N-methyltransferase